MEYEIKTTTTEDYKTTEFLTRETFWNLYKSGCDEHLVLHNLRKSKNYIKALDLVAFTDENKIIGHIIVTKAYVLDLNKAEHEVLCVGPISVHPDFQNLGIGSNLLLKAIEKAKEMGYKGMLLFGNPNYYRRFGFDNAKKFEITTKDGNNFDPFMTLELYNNALNKIKGKFFEDSAFFQKNEELETFELQFPSKVKSKPKIDLSNLL